MVSHGAAVIVALLALNLAVSCHASLQYGFYKGKCKNQDVETIIRNIVTARWFGDQKIVAGLLRLQFHDCFVRGCDASLLLDGPTSEKTAFPNLTVFGYDLIDQIKAALESACPGVVSCADIIIAATRDAVVLAGGQRYEVQLGRRDGTVSQASLVNLPAPEFSVPAAIQFFAQRGFTTRDMVLLLGAHTVGVTHCSIINNRLYNWNGSGRPDPNMDPFYAMILQNVACPTGQTFDNFVFLDDPSSVLKVDNSYYNQLLRKRGILPIDQALALDPTTKPIVQQLASNNGLFLSQFGQALVKMGAFQVLTGTQGQIRKNCRRAN